MEHAFGAAYDRPDAWEIAPDVSEASLTMPTRRGPRVLLRFPGFRGSFYLRPTGELAGFAFFLPVPAVSSPLQSRRRPSRSLFWESVDISHDDARNFTGDGRLRLDDQEVWATVNGRIAQIPCRGSALPYLKVVLMTEFRAVGLGWPRPAALRVKRVRLDFFTEIRARRRR